MAFSLNSNLPTSYVKPIIAVQIDTNAPAVGNAEEARTVLLWGEQLPSGIAPVNSIQQLNSINDAIVAYGKQSTIARTLRAALSQPGAPGTARFYGAGVAPAAAGVAGVIKIVVNVADATGAAATNPLAAGGINLTVGGTEVASVSYSTTDTATTIGASLLAALNALEWSPWTWTHNTGTLTGTYNIKGAVSEDFPFRVTYTNPGTGVWLGPGSLTLATNATGAGSLSVVCGATTVTAALAGGATPTVAADALVAALGGVSSTGAVTSAPDGPLTCGKNVAGVTPLYFQAGKDYRRVNVAVVTSTGMTATLTGGTATDGTGAGVPTYSGTPGSGAPTLASAVAAARGYGSFGKQVAPWLDATSLSAIFSAIVSDGDGGPSHQKGQTITVCHVGTEAAAKAVIASTTPVMSAMTQGVNEGMRGVVAHCPDAAQPGVEIAARIAALRASVAGPFTNYDGLPLGGTSSVPLLNPSEFARVTYTDGIQNTAIQDGLTPVAVQNGQLCIVFGRTTAGTTANELWDWSWIDQADAHRLDLRSIAAPTFKGCALIAPGTVPRSRVDVDPQAIEAFLKDMLGRWEIQGTYDGADALAPACKARINATVRTRADAVYPESPKVPLHTLGIVAQRSAPPIA